MANRSRYYSQSCRSDCRFKVPPTPQGRVRQGQRRVRVTPRGGRRGAARRLRLLRACLAPPRPRPSPSPSAGPPPPAPCSWASDAGAAAAAFHPQEPATARVLLLLPQRPAARARPGHARRRGDPTGSAGGRAQRRSRFGDAGAASAPFPEVSAPLPGELSPPPGLEGRLCVSGARGRLSGHWRARTSSGSRASARPPATAPAGVSTASRAEVAGSGRSEGGGVAVPVPETGGSDRARRSALQGGGPPALRSRRWVS